MFIKLTNASTLHKGKQLAIDTSIILTMNQASVEFTHEGDTYQEEVTYLFCPPHGTWEVSESIDEIVEMTNKVK